MIMELGVYCEKHKLSLAPLLEAVGIDPNCRQNPNALVPLNATMKLFHDVGHALNDPEFGLNFAKSFKPGASGLAGLLLIHAPTVREALEQLAKLGGAHSPQLDAQFVVSDGGGKLKWTYPPTITAPRLHFVSFAVAGVLRRLREGAGDDWRPRIVEFEHRAPDDLAPYVAVFGERVRFEAPAYVLSLDAGVLSRPLRNANPAVFALAVDLAQRWMESERDVPDIVREVRHVIAGQLPNGAPSLDEVATNLHLTVSQLQWRLEQAGTSFERVLTGMRTDLASHLLSNTNKSITEIAFELGFTDPSTFSRAARRWFKVTPLDYRRKARRSEKGLADE